MKKIVIKKEAKKIDLEEIFGENFSGAWVSVWKDPSRPVIRQLTKAMMDAESIETEEDAANFWEGATRFFLDTNIADVSFGSVEEVQEAFEHPDLPWLFFHKVLIVALGKVIQENDQLKKVAMRSRDPTTSGKDSSEAEQ